MSVIERTQQPVKRKERAVLAEQPAEEAVPGYSPWTWRVVAVLVTVVFPLIWFGGLVTSSDAGMAVPDWPGTYGYNMFLYPFSSWFFGPWDFFLEHGHRLIGSTAGLVAIGLVATCIRCDQRRWVWWLSGGLLLLVIFQGLLGGLRVVIDARTIAKLHGCVGPAFFASAAAFCVVLSRWWRDQGIQASRSASAGRAPLALGPAERQVWRGAHLWLALSFTQLVIGAFLRHVGVDGSPQGFQHLVYTHVALACIVLGGTHLYAGRVRRLPGVEPRIRSAARWLSALVTLQFLLGLSTWIVKYNWPSWLDSWTWTAQFVIPEKTMWQTNIVTLHVAIGSAIVACWAVLTVRCWRVFGLAEKAAAGAELSAERAERWQIGQGTTG
ncbi:MAG: COX15/CtaA family protein [Planctomycetota bacterium]